MAENTVEVRRFELLTSSVRGKRSAGLSYTPGSDAMVDEVPGHLARVCGLFSLWYNRNYPGSRFFHGSSLALSDSWVRSRSCTIVVVRSARDLSTRARETSVVRRNPAVMPSG